MDLFDYQKEKNLNKQAPLASRMRPDNLDDFVGQSHILGKDKLLYRAIKADKLSSIIFYGSTGTGKTTLAKIIASTTKSIFLQLNATNSGAKDIKETIEESKVNIAMYNKRTILFIDEIHRFNKSQQDMLLPYVEDGTIILIGATTENPYYEVNKALVSRSILFQLNPLKSEDIKRIILNAINNTEKGYGLLKIKIDEQSLEFIADVSNGDARTALNALEIAVLTTEHDENNVIKIDIKIAEECIQQRKINYDKESDNHYDTISAFIKSMRGSDPDASLYYLAKMIYAGEDPKFIARRIVICASEDVGNADPHALQIAVSAAYAVSYVGLPECKINLAQAVAYIASAPKSNSAVKGINKAMEDVSKIKISNIPYHLKYTNHIKGSSGYKYPHDYPGNYVKQQYLPDELVGKIYYEPSNNGVEKKIKESLNRLREC